MKTVKDTIMEKNFSKLSKMKKWKEMDKLEVSEFFKTTFCAPRSLMVQWRWFLKSVKKWGYNTRTTRSSMMQPHLCQTPSTNRGIKFWSTKIGPRSHGKRQKIYLLWKIPLVIQSISFQSNCHQMMWYRETLMIAGSLQLSLPLLSTLSASRDCSWTKLMKSIVQISMELRFARTECGKM